MSKEDRKPLSPFSGSSAFGSSPGRNGSVAVEVAVRSKTKDMEVTNTVNTITTVAGTNADANANVNANKKGIGSNNENSINQQQSQASCDGNSTTILVHDSNSNPICDQENAWKKSNGARVSSFDKVVTDSDNNNSSNNDNSCRNNNPPVNFLLVKRKSSLQNQSNQNNSSAAMGPSDISPSKQMKLHDENSQSNPVPLPTQKNKIKNYFTTASNASSSAISSLNGGVKAKGSKDNPVIIIGSNSNSNSKTGSGGGNNTTTSGSNSSSLGILSSSSTNSNSNSNSNSISSNSKHSNSSQHQIQTVSNIDDQRKTHVMEQKMQRLESDLNQANEYGKKLSDQNSKLKKSLEEVYRSRARQEMRRKRDRLASDSVRIGKLVTQRTGPTSVADIWEEGWALKDISRRSAGLITRKEELEKRRKKLATEKRKRKGVNSSNNGGGAGDQDDNGPSDQSASAERMELDILAEESAIKYHSEELKRDSEALAEEKKFLETEKAAHMKEMRRCLSEDRSRFTRDLPCLHGRYVLTSLLGRGGFSEVWKAFDLNELRDVAVKVHQLNNAWNDDRKQSYIKHVTREYEIHGKMQHPRVVSMHDVFEIDVNSFATVLEYCEGTDLDEKLKRLRLFPEKDAKTILFQVLSGLRYLHESGDNTVSAVVGASDGVHQDQNPNPISTTSSSSSKKKSIIHYDLKPANILFDKMGDAKITDFGLSKIIDSQSEGTSMELTSQGAGTYWYLPPECFEDNARISTKVDVWSMGVILYQMLFGKRPFGEGRSQERILQEGIIRHATQVDFPDVPKVSEEAKDFIRMCLTANQSLRPDIGELVNHRYVKNH